MSILDILILAEVLSIDACAVSFSNGLVLTRNKRVSSLILAGSFGLFQFLMPVAGYFFAQEVNKYIEPYSRWIGFGIFLLLGLKFIKDAFEEKRYEFDCCLCFKYIFIVSVATSIDALGAGVLISFTKIPVLFPAVIIGIVTFLNSLACFWSGYLFKKFPSRNLEIMGGIILILLAFKFLFEK